jgi:hypothetical protein
MATYPTNGAVPIIALEDDAGESANRLYVSDIGASISSPPQWTAPTLASDNFLELLGPLTGSDSVILGSPTIFSNSYPCDIAAVPQDTFFGQIIVLPRKIAAGFVLTTQVFTIDVYNSYIDEQRTWQNFVNNAGGGINITNLPSLPDTVEEQDGPELNLEILVDGPAFIEGTLDFIFDVGTFSVELTGQRANIWAFEPEEPGKEKLLWLTDILRKRDGTEQRQRLREAPRQEIEYTYLNEGVERQTMETLIFEGQGRSYGVPIVWEPTFATSAITATDLTVNVETTAYADYRVGGLAIMWKDFNDFEVLTIQSLTATSLTFVTAFQNSFALPVKVMPMRVGFMQRSTRSEKEILNLQETRVRFSIFDSDLDLADDSAFPQYNSKPILEEPNLVVSKLNESQDRPLTIIDSKVGEFTVFTEQAISKRRHLKGFFSGTRQRLWEVRQLLHSLHGRQKSFYIPTFFGDVSPTSGVSSGSSTLAITNIGYNRFVQERQPRNVIQLRALDGTKITREVLSSVEVDSDNETLTVDSNWGQTIALADIDYITFVEKVRMDRDEARFEHRVGDGNSTVTMPVVSVLD